MTGFSVNIDWEAIYNQPWVSSSGGAGVKATAEYWSSRAEGFARKAHPEKPPELRAAARPFYLV